MGEKTSKPILTGTIQAVSACVKMTFCGFDGDLCAAGAKALGVFQVDGDAGEFVPVDHNGVILVLSGAAVAVGAEVQSNADGKAITKDTGVSNGWAMDEATGANQIIRIARGI
jgi:hypothetical protein